MFNRSGVSLIITGLMFFSLFTGCDVTKDATVEFDYTREPVVVFNPDWTILPLPTNLMNPGFVRAIEVDVPGMPEREFPDYCVAPEDQQVSCMDLRMVVDTESTEASSQPEIEDYVTIADIQNITSVMGYDLEADSNLTLYLKNSLNRLDGYYPGFIPDIPLSRKIDLASIKPFGEGENDFNVENANFFFMDITDKENPQVISFDEYQFVFDVESRESFPYRLTLRNNPDVANNHFMPMPFKAGNVYQIVLTGVNGNGIKDTEGVTFSADSPFLLLAGETPYVAPDGSSRNNLFTDLDYVQEIEEARQVTDYGLQIWQSLVGDKRKRSEVIAAFNFSIASTPESVFMDPQEVIMTQNPLVPEGAIGKKYDKENVLKNTCVKTGVDFTPMFSLSGEIDLSTANTQNVKLYQKLEDGNYKDVAISVSAENVNGVGQITITPKDDLDSSTHYLVAAKSSIKAKKGTVTNSDVYCALVKSKYPIIENKMWNSPFLDSRPDILVSLEGLPDTLIDKDELHANPTEVTTTHLVSILSLIEEIRKDYQPDVEYLLTTDFVDRREDILILYTFSPAGCPEDGPEPINPDEYDTINLVDADLTGDFDLEATFSHALLDSEIIMNMFGEFVQTGVILDESAVLSGTLYEADGKTNGVKLDDASIDKDGNFELTLKGFNVSADLSDQLYADTLADITMTGVVYNSFRVRGNVVAKMKDVDIGDGFILPELVLEGVFVATRRVAEKGGAHE